MAKTLGFEGHIAWAHAMPQFTWDAGYYVVDRNVLSVSVPNTFGPRGPGSATQTLELISNAEGRPVPSAAAGDWQKGNCSLAASGV
jgi:hypothetical protein